MMRLTSLLTGVLVIAASIITGITSAAAVAPQAKATVTVWDIQTGAEQALLKSAATAFTRSHPGIKISYDWYQNDPYKTKIDLALGAHHGPDVFMGWGGGVLQSYVKSGVVYDLTNALKKDAAWRTHYIPSVMGAVTFGGHMYGVPYNETQPEVVVYNKTIFSQYNLKPATTWPQFLKLVTALKSHNVIPIALAGKSVWPEMIPMQYLADRIGGPSALANIAYRKGGSFNSAPWIKAATLAQELVKSGAYQSGFSSFNYDTGDASQLVYNGRAAMMFMGVWQFRLALTEAPKHAKDLDFFPFPTVPGGKGNIHDIVGNPANFYSINNASKHKAAALTFLKSTLNKTVVNGLLKAGALPPVRNLNTSGVTDPILKKQSALLRTSTSFQQPVDQLLPAELAQDFLDLVGKLYVQQITPQEFAKQMQAKTVAYFKNHP